MSFQENSLVLKMRMKFAVDSAFVLWYKNKARRRTRYPAAPENVKNKILIWRQDYVHYHAYQGDRFPQMVRP